ncbi:MAG: GNAT family N-acetyltransferase [Candidatus Heimdallarchaeota archaeon]|nr:GNAT family N-acetyltransferase [Candidatus Heimdallarchaeota archaeon]
MVLIHPISANSENHYFKALAKLYLLMVPKTSYSINEMVKSFKKAAESDQEQNMKLGIDGTTFLAYEEGTEQPLGYGSLQLNEHENRFVSSQYAHIYVHPEFRRRGVGTILLHQIKGVAAQIDGVKTVFFFADEKVGKKFLVNNSGTIVEKGKVYELRLNSYSIQKIQSLEEITIPKLSIDIIERPEDKLLKEFLEVYNTSNADAPFGQATREKLTHSLQSLRELFHYGNDVSIGAFAYYAGRPVGISHLRLLSHIDEACYQKHTGVHPQYRRQGIATAMKVKLLQWLHQTYPQRTIIKTEVLDENIIMRKVNEKVGFQPVKLQITVEFDLRE